MTQKQKGFVGLGALVVLAGVTIFGSTPIYNMLDKMAVKSVSYTPGTYTGSAQGFGGEVKATVTVSESGIEAVELVGNDETPELGGAALEKLPAKFLEAQSSMVDAIAGCTITSDAAKAAVQQALDKSANGEPGDAGSAEAETTAKAEETTTAQTETNDEKVSYVPGTYEGSAQGFGGEVKATVTIGEDGIETVELVGDDETPELGGAALEKLAPKFTEAQSSKVDAVSGCTITSDAAMAAVQQALDQASGSAEGQEAAAEAVSYAPGTYEGSAQGFGGEVKATVTIGEDGIETVELVGDDETPELGGAALEKLAPKFTEAQSSKVDAVSGCTITSDAAMAAVQQALDQASGSAEGQEAAAEAVSYAPGTYEGSAQGFGGEVKATVTIGENGIETVELVGDDETPELGGAALEKLAPKFTEAQSSKVDAVSGCTITSDAAIAAVQQALDQANE